MKTHNIFISVRNFFKKSLPKPDILFCVIVLCLAAFGTLMVFSAGYAYADARYNDSLYFVKKQIVWLTIGIAVLYFASRISINSLKKITPLLYITTLLLLILVLVVGFVGNGAKRWISVGPITIQPSEIAKFTLIITLAYYFSNYESVALSKEKRKYFLFGTLIPAAIMLIPIVLVMLQKHLSCIIILCLIGAVMIIASGANLRYMYGFGALGCLGIICLAIFTDYTKERITVWRNPEAYKLTGGWQTLQGLMAIGSGGIFGVGYGKSVMKHCYVSEPANDMIFAILCEELGFVGALTVFVLFFLLISRGILISLRVEDTFSRLLIFGLSAKTAITKRCGRYQQYPQHGNFASLFQLRRFFIDHVVF